MTRNDPPKGAAPNSTCAFWTRLPMIHRQVLSRPVGLHVHEFWARSRLGERYTNAGDGTDLSRRLSADIAVKMQPPLPQSTSIQLRRLWITGGEWFGNPYARASRKEVTE